MHLHMHLHLKYLYIRFVHVGFAHDEKRPIDRTLYAIRNVFSKPTYLYIRCRMVCTDNEYSIQFAFEKYLIECLINVQMEIYTENLSTVCGCSFEFQHSAAFAFINKP